MVAPAANPCRWLATGPPEARGAVVVVQRGYSLDCGDTAAAQAVRQAGGLAMAAVALLPLLPTGVPQPVGVAGLPCSLLPPLLGGWVVGNASEGVALTLTRKTVGRGWSGLGGVWRHGDETEVWAICCRTVLSCINGSHTQRIGYSVPHLCITPSSLRETHRRPRAGS